MRAQQLTNLAPALVLDRVTVVDVERGKLVPDQRVVIAGNRIRDMGTGDQIKITAGARVVDARGKYLIPGLWDMHVHPQHYAPDVFYPMFIGYGVTGIRDAWSYVPLDTLIQWRREILAGMRVGPPRQILSGAAIDGREECTRTNLTGHVCVSTSDLGDAARVGGALKAAGADMLKMYNLSNETYRLLAREARRAGLPFGGHLFNIDGSMDLTAMEASDSGLGILDHFTPSAGLHERCLEIVGGSVELCRSVAEQLRHNGTWWAPTLAWLWVWTPEEDMRSPSPRLHPIVQRLKALDAAFWGDSLSRRDSAGAASVSARLGPRPASGPGSAADSLGFLSIAQRVGLPILAGTDVAAPDGTVDRNLAMIPGLSLHAELEMEVAEGLKPLTALQNATLNPAKFLHATDSMGTVAPGKLADLILLDADPLADITNTTAIRAVVANGRYFDRASLDQLLVEAHAASQKKR